MILRFGNRSDEVKRLQNLLISNGYTLPVTGLFHNTTLSSVKNFQKRNGLVVDGIVGKFTWSALEGVDSKYLTLPLPISNKSLEATRDTLRPMLALVDFNIEDMLVIIGMESNYDYTIKASTSSATGWFQFLNATWDEMVSKHGRKYGIVNDAKRSSRLDPRANALMGIEFTKGNQRYLKSKTGFMPNITDTYIAHFLGMGTAVKFINADPETLGTVLLPREARSNPRVFYAGGQPRTLGEIRIYFEKLLDRTILNVKKVL